MHLDSTFLGVHLDSTFLGVHLDSMFLGVHLDSTFLGVHLDSMFLGVHLRPWVCTWIARRYRDSSSRLGIDLQEKQLLLSEARTRAAGGGEVKTGEEEL